MFDSSVECVKAGTGDTVLLMTFDCYVSVKKPVYAFSTKLTPPDSRGAPLHDHRDNVTGGGFAFATYHPGTGLPQQPWYG